MSRFKFVALVLAPLALSVFMQHQSVSQSNGLESQRTALTQVGQALSHVVVKAKKVNEKLGYGFNQGGCVFGVKLRLGSGAKESFLLQKNQSYVFIGGGDRTARNVDLVLRDATGRVLTQDIEADAAPFILFQPKVTGRYTLSLNLKSGWKGPAFCAVTVLRKGGIQVPLERIVEAAIRQDYATWNVFRDARGGSINEAPNSWALYGAVLRPGQAFTSSPKRFGAAYRGIVAVGDSQVRALNLALLDSTGKVKAGDTRHRALPRITRKIGAGSYSVRVSNRLSSGPAMTLALLLDVPTPVSTPVPPLIPTPTPDQNPTLTSQSENVSFEGNWKGEWVNQGNGNFRMRVKSDGSCTGHFSVPALNVAGKFKGTISGDGKFRWNYTQSKKDFTVTGTLQSTSEKPDKVQGQARFSSGDNQIGLAEFWLEKQD